MMTRARWLLPTFVLLLAQACSSSSSSVDDRGAGDGPPVLLDAHTEGTNRDGSVPGSDGPLPDRGAAQSCPVLPATFDEGKTPTLEIHVAVGGNDLTATGTPGAPYGSISAAVEDGRVVPGVAIRVHAGTYTVGASVDNIAGTADAPIWVGGAPGEAPPVFEGERLFFTRVRYLVLHDLVVRNTDGAGINCDDGAEYDNPEAARYVVFRRLTISDIAGDGSDCLLLSGVNDYVVLESELSRCGSGIEQVGCHRGLVVGNRISETASSAVQANGGSTEIEVRANWIESPGLRGVNMGGQAYLDEFRPPLSSSVNNAEARNVRVIANVIQGGEAALAFVGCVDCLAANNTIVDPTRFPLRILQENVTGDGWTFEPCGGGRVINNIILYAVDGIDSYVNVGDDTAAATFTFANNLWYARDWPAYSEPQRLPVAETGGVYGAEPRFGDESGGDFSIDGASPAAFAGLDATELTADYRGICFRAPPSIGAFEVR